MNHPNGLEPKKSWKSPLLVIIGTDTISKNTFVNFKEANYHNVGGTHYDNSKGTKHINKSTYNSIAS